MQRMADLRNYLVSIKKIWQQEPRVLTLRPTSFLLVLMSSLVLSACSDQGGDPQNVDAAATKVAESQPQVVVETAVAEPLDELALKRLGELSFIKCRSCHTLGKDEPHSVGPNLNGLFGATAGTKEGYNYSEPLANSGIVWDKATLGGWIVSPPSLVAGNKMAFIGISDSNELKALLAYLSENTK